jgi:hypothetical protein
MLICETFTSIIFRSSKEASPSPIDEQDKNEDADEARVIRNLFDEEAIEENEEPEVVIEEREEPEEAGEEEFEGFAEEESLKPREKRMKKKCPATMIKRVWILTSRSIQSL